MFTDQLLFVSSLSLIFSFLIDFSCGLAFHNPSFLSLKKPNPRYFISLGLDTLLFVMLTLSPSFFSMKLDTFSITLSAAFELPTKMIQSSAYRVNRNPLASSSLSNSFSTILLNNGDKFPPCGVPITDSLYSLSIIIPLTRNFLIKDTISPLFTFFMTRVISLSWCTLSKNFSKSMSTTHWNPSFMYSNAFKIAISQHLFGLNP